MDVAELSWESRHLYYEGDARPWIDGCLRPLARSLPARREIDSFFFVRYRDEAGPHLRLRFRLAGGGASGAGERPARVDALLADALARSAAVSPPGEGGPGLPRCEEALFEPEVERYGGAAVLGASLDFFALSSAHALAYVANYGARPRSRQLPLGLALLLWQAWGFARDREELLGLVGYQVGDDGGEAAHARADSSFEQEPARWTALVAGQLAALAAARETFGWDEIELGSCGCVAAGARRLSRDLQGLDGPLRLGVGTSQLHMTANRLGLGNWEESFILRLMERSLFALEAAGRLAALDAELAASRSRSGSWSESLTDLIPRHFAALE